MLADALVNISLKLLITYPTLVRRAKHRFPYSKNDRAQHPDVNHTTVFVWYDSCHLIISFSLQTSLPFLPGNRKQGKFDGLSVWLPLRTLNACERLTQGRPSLVTARLFTATCV